MALHPGFVTSAATTALDTRLAEASYFVRNGDQTVRTGVLWDAGMNGVLVTTTATTNPMTVSIPVSNFVLSRGNFDGVTKIGNDGGVAVTIGTAPAAGQSRIDVIYVRQNDATQGDADNNPIFGVMAGTAATTGSQTKPALTTLPGALELATILVPGGATSTQSAGVALTQTFQYSGFTGAVIPFRDMASLKAWVPEDNAMARVIGGFNIAYVYNTSAAVWRPLGNAVLAYYSGAGTCSNNLEQTATVSSYSQTGTDNDVISYSSGVPQVQQDGWYRVSATCAWANNATGIRSLQITTGVSGDTSLPALPGASCAAVSGAQTWLSTEVLTYQSAGSYFKPKVFQNSGGNLNYNASISVELVK